MLPRAALRTAGLRNLTASSLHRVPAAVWTRQYAHFNKPGSGAPKKPSGPPYQAPNRTARPTDFTNANAKSKDRSPFESQKETPEFNEDASPLKNTTPKAQPGPSISTGKIRSRPDPESDAAQVENEGPQSADENTAPTSQPKEAPSKPLPDLRHGIPSTFAEEFLKQSDSGKTARSAAGRESQVLSDTEKLDEEIEHAKQESDAQQALGGRGGGGSGELPRSAYETSTDRRRNTVLNYTYLSMLVFAVVGAVYLGRDWDTDEEEKKHRDTPSGWNLASFWGRIKARVNDSMGYYTEPSFPKLLPVLDPAPPYTLVLSLEDLMIHSEWTRQHGYRTAKRPGLDYFLRYLSQYYEIVLFTSLPSAQVEPVYRKLDPYRIIMWPLFREATRYHKGEYIKDLSYLNRDLSKVIILDTKAAHVSANPENAIVLPPWKGDPKDRDLVSYVPFLENVAAMSYPDVRKALKSFEGTHIPTEYARREAVSRERFNAEEGAKRRGGKSGWSVGGLISSSLGMKPQPAPGAMVFGEDGQTAAAGFDKGLMLSDQIRERGRKGYEENERQIRENGAKWLKEWEEEEKKMAEESLRSMKGNVGGAMGWFGGGQQQQQQQETDGQAKSSGSS